MPVFVLQNEYADLVAQDLARVAYDPISVDLGLANVAGAVLRGTGEVRFLQAPVTSTPGTQLLDALINMPVWVGVRGERSDFSVFPRLGYQLRICAGAVDWDAYPAPAPDHVWVVYDGAMCDGRGFQVPDDGNFPIDLPRDVILFHELAHALEAIAGTFNVDDPEAYALARENEYRAFYGLPHRSSHFGICTISIWQWNSLIHPNWWSARTIRFLWGRIAGLFGLGRGR